MMFNKPTGTASGIKNKIQIERDNQKAKQAWKKENVKWKQTSKDLLEWKNVDKN